MRDRVILLIPGNPGDAYYYRGFADVLRQRGHEVAVFDHARLLRAPKTMAPYAEHQAGCLLDYLHCSGRSPAEVEIVLLGHSIGGYLAHLIAKHGMLPIARAVLLFPFLAKPSSGALRALAAWRYLGGPFVRLLRRLPARWHRALVRSLGLEAHANHLLATFAGEHALSYPAMGVSEYREVGLREDASYILRESTLAARGRLACLFASNDRWSPVNAQPDLAGVSHQLDGDVKHAFVLEPESWPRIADALGAQLNPPEAGSRRGRCSC